MKKYNLILGCVLGLFSLGILTTSCEDLLKEKSFDFISEAPNTEEGALQYMAGTYSYLLNDMFRYDQFFKVLDMDGDYNTGPDWALSAIGAGNFRGSDAMDPMWNKCYTMIERANEASEKISTMSIDKNIKAENMAEMDFLKALSYFWLVRAYGEVPIKKQSMNENPAFDVPRSSIADVYAYIIELLKSAEENMYANTDVKFVKGHASAGAAAALLAKVYLTMASGSLESGNVTVKGGIAFTRSGDSKKFTNPVDINVAKDKVAGYDFNSHDFFVLARDKAKQVMDGNYGSYDLMAYDDLWTIANRGAGEHIFQIQPLSGSDLYGAGIARWYTGTTDGSEMIIEGLFLGMRDHWYKLFEKNDYRIVKGIMHRWINRDYHQSWNGGGFYPNNDEWSIKARGYYIAGKDTIYDDPSTGLPFVKDPIFDDGRSYTNDNTSAYIAFQTKYFNATDRSQVKSDVPWPVLRFADVLLIYAEAENEANGGPTTPALNALNRVRVRSNASGKTLDATTGIGTLEKFRSAVLEERAREFACEGDRRWDLVRWGIYLQTMNAIDGFDEVGVQKTRSSQHLLYPIPDNEMLSNKAIKNNNPGW